MNMMDKKTEQLSKLLRCNLILTDDDGLIFGLTCDIDFYSAPYILVKDNSSESYYCFIQTAIAFKIPIEKNRSLTRALFIEVNEGDIIPEKYLKSVSVIYMRLYPPKKELSDFEKRLDKDIRYHIYRFKQKTFCSSYKNWSKNQKTVLSDQNKDNSINLKDSLLQLAKTKELEFKESYDPLRNIHSFIFEHNDNKEVLFFQLMVLVDSNGKIFVGNQYVFQDFDADKTSSALELVNAFIGEKEHIVQIQKEYTKEWSISSKIFDIAINSIKALLEINSNHNNIDFKRYSDCCASTIYLHKKNCPNMYELTISYKEFLRCPEAFKEMIANPYKKEKKHFWCEEQKFDPKLFAKD